MMILVGSLIIFGWFRFYLASIIFRVLFCNLFFFLRTWTMKWYVSYLCDTIDIVTGNGLGIQRKRCIVPLETFESHCLSSCNPSIHRGVPWHSGWEYVFFGLATKAEKSDKGKMHSCINTCNTSYLTGQKGNISQRWHCEYTAEAAVLQRSRDHDQHQFGYKDSKESKPAWNVQAAVLLQPFA